ncbi:DUF2199 domain-containing protein [Paenibacillus apiarius]|uniref:DUF2199 domain-containing protein n=1 Tax=Paenibacillus apiarius TaxID=46240 RepID=UPI00197EA2A8|nr:DUF2199 domain-containing protein [Paenibacillus apiarius]MBN3522986.1 DUF2199 domain-containing protein [Paenibacillus apiarius]
MVTTIQTCANSRAHAINKRRRPHRIRLRKQGEPSAGSVYTNCSAPFYVTEIEPWEREERCRLTAEECVMDDQYYYVHGRLTVPFRNGRGQVSWDVWVLINPEHVADGSKKDTQSKPKQVRGRLSSAIPGYPDTLALPVKVTFYDKSTTPDIILGETEHPLYEEQEQGITFQRWLELRPLHASYHRYTDAQ